MSNTQPVTTEANKSEQVLKVGSVTIPQITDPDFWCTVSDNLTIDGAHNTDAFDLDNPDKLHEKLVREGYVHLSQPGLHTPLDHTTEVLGKIVEMGLPPVFSFVYDEFWMIGTQLRHMVSMALHEEYVMLPDFWAWRVAPGQAGWTPHRDKLSGSLYEDKTPKSVTVWVPLSIAHPLNGCMYVLPADRDRLYAIDKKSQFGGRLPDIRALPADAGDVLMWTQHVMHWGAHSAEDHGLPPRMSVAFEFQRRDEPAFNKPLLDPHTLPSFEERLALIAKQVLQYTHMYGFSEDLVAVAKNLRSRFDMPPAVV